MLITGASRGIGESFAHAFAGAGARSQWSLGPRPPFPRSRLSSAAPPTRRPFGPDAGRHPHQSRRGRSGANRRSGEQRRHRDPRRLRRRAPRRASRKSPRSTIWPRRAVPADHPPDVGAAAATSSTCPRWPAAPHPRPVTTYSASKAALSISHWGCGPTSAGCRSTPPWWSWADPHRHARPGPRTTSRSPDSCRRFYRHAAGHGRPPRESGQ